MGGDSYANRSLVMSAVTERAAEKAGRGMQAGGANSQGEDHSRRASRRREHFRVLKVEEETDTSHRVRSNGRGNRSEKCYTRGNNSNG